MSLVTLMANNKEVYLCGDKRTTRMKQGEDGSFQTWKIFDDSIKVYKVNESVIIGSVGSISVSNIFLAPAIKDGIVNEKNRECSYSAFVKEFNSRINDIISIISNSDMTKDEYSFVCLVAGIDNGKIVATTYGYPMVGGCALRHEFEEDDYASTTIGISGYNNLFCSNYENTNGEVAERIAEAFGKTLEIVSRENETVGTTYDIVRVTL